MCASCSGSTRDKGKRSALYSTPVLWAFAICLHGAAVYTVQCSCRRFRRLFLQRTSGWRPFFSEKSPLLKVRDRSDFSDSERSTAETTTSDDTCLLRQVDDTPLVVRTPRPTPFTVPPARRLFGTPSSHVRDVRRGRRRSPRGARVPRLAGRGVDIVVATQRSFATLSSSARGVRWEAGEDEEDEVEQDQQETSRVHRTG